MKGYYETALKIAGGAAIIGALAAGTVLMYRNSGESSFGKWVSSYMTNHYEAARDAAMDPIGSTEKAVDEARSIPDAVRGRKPENK